MDSSLMGFVVLAVAKPNSGKLKANMAIIVMKAVSLFFEEQWL